MPQEAVMDRREIEDLIIGLLAKDGGRDPEALREELDDLGELLPIDSVLAAEVLARVEAAYGVEFPATAEASKHLRSVVNFADAILELVRKQGVSAAETA
jgi:acyl carrier protein